MPTIIFSPSAQLTQVEDFPADCERTIKGALHVRPGATCTVTSGEAEHLKKRGIAFMAVGKWKGPSAEPLPGALSPVSPLPSSTEALPDEPPVQAVEGFEDEDDDDDDDDEIASDEDEAK